jgi:hypothetical protein
VKHCISCNQDKPLDSFYQDAKASDKKMSWCKDCVKANAKKHCQLYGRKRSIKKRHYPNNAWKLKHPGKVKACRDNWKRLNADIEKQHSKVFRAIRSGRLKRSEVCTFCRRIGKTQAHHSDYSKPLEVLWLCHSCHQLIHEYSQCPSLEGLIPQRKVG